jgi:hypothetical protein
MPPEDKTPITADDLATIDTSDADADNSDTDGGNASANDKGADESGGKPADAPLADKGRADPADDQKGGKAAADDGKKSKKPIGGSVFDADDGDDDASVDDKKPSGKKADDASGDGDDADTDDKKDEKSGDDDWRLAIVDKITAKLEETMTASKLKKQRTAIMNQLKRMKSPEEAIIAGLAAKQKLSEGAHKELFPVDAPDEEKAERRKELGLPAAADEYTIPNVPGHEWKKDDDGLLGEFRETAFGLGLSQPAVNELVSWHVRQSKQEEEAMEETMASGDAADREAVEDHVRLQVGVSEFKPQMKIISRLMDDAFGEEGRRILTSARFYDPETKRWRLFSNMPQFMEGMGEMARSIYGDGGYVTPDQKVSLNNEKAEIEKLRKEDNDAYYRVDSKTGKSPADRLLEIKQEEERRENRYRK